MSGLGHCVHCLLIHISHGQVINQSRGSNLRYRSFHSLHLSYATGVNPFKTLLLIYQVMKLFIERLDCLHKKTAPNIGAVFREMS